MVGCGPSTMYEVNNVIKKLKWFKSAGPDGLSPSLFKEGGDLLLHKLTELFHSIWVTEQIPEEWCLSTIIPIFKKGDRTSCENHRGISLITIASKILAGILLQRLTVAREEIISETQAGFRPSRGCIDHLFTLRQVIEQRHAYRRPTILVFLDLKSAFDSVDRRSLWYILESQGVPVNT